MIRIFVAIVCFSLTAADYCDSSLCPSQAKHIACGNSRDFNAACPADKRIETLDQDHINLILDLHNQKRNEVASGKCSDFKTAKRMAAMVSFLELLSFL